MGSENRTRDQTLVIRLSEEERRELGELAEQARQTIADVVRKAIRKSHTHVFGFSPRKGKR